MKDFRGAIFKKSVAIGHHKTVLNKIYSDFFTHGAGEVFASLAYMLMSAMLHSY